MGQNAAQAITDRCKSLAAAGDPAPLEVWRNQKGHKAKRSFGIKLGMQPDGKWAKAWEEQTTGFIQSCEITAGMLSLWEIAKEEGIPFSQDYGTSARPRVRPFARSPARALARLPARPLASMAARARP